MKYHPFAFWLIPLVIGIWLASHCVFSIYEIGTFTLIALILHIVISFLRIHKSLLFITSALLIFGVGALRYIQFNANSSGQIPLTKEKSLYQVRINKTLKPSEKYLKFETSIWVKDSAENSSYIKTSALLYLKKQAKPIHTHDVFWVYGRLGQIPTALNPHTFDYAQYMNNRRIYFQIFSDGFASQTHAKSTDINHRLSEFKQGIRAKLMELDFSPTGKVFISSLALGDRTDLDKDFQEKLSSVGVMHLFAISGLHVGIIFMFIMVVLYPLLFLKNGKYLRWILALIIIWIFAWFVGFTPSVTRAAFMISIYYFTLLLGRNTNIYHTLALSAFVLLLIRPNQLFDVGFQLSYSAVFYIAWFYKPVRMLMPHYNKPIKNYFFNLLSLTLVAQFGVLPISIFYFHKITGLFLLGNLVILPFASVMVLLSFGIVGLIALNWLHPSLVQVINAIFNGIGGVIDYLSSFESLIFPDISLNGLQVVLCLAILVMLRSMVVEFRWRKLIPVLSLLLLFQISRLYQEHLFRSKQEIIVFHQYKGSIIGVRNGANLDIFWQVNDSTQAVDYIIKPYQIYEKIKHVNYYHLMDSKRGIVYFKNKNLLKINDKAYFITNKTLSSFPPVEHIILTQSPYQLPENSLEKTKRIIADGSNYPSNIQRLKEISDKIYYTQEQGAYLEAIQ